MKMFQLGFQPVHSSYGVFIVALVGTRFNKYIDVLKPHPITLCEAMIQPSYFSPYLEVSDSAVQQCHSYMKCLT